MAPISCKIRRSEKAKSPFWSGRKQLDPLSQQHSIWALYWGPSGRLAIECSESMKNELVNEYIDTKMAWFTRTYQRWWILAFCYNQISFIPTQYTQTTKYDLSIIEPLSPVSLYFVLCELVRYSEWIHHLQPNMMWWPVVKVTRATIWALWRQRRT